MKPMSKGQHSKICILGSSNSGKTHLCFFLVSRVFPAPYKVFYFGVEKELAKKMLSVYHVECLTDLTACASASNGLLIWDDFDVHSKACQVLLHRILSVTSHHCRLSLMLLCQEFRENFLSKHMASFHSVIMPLVPSNALLCRKLLQNLRMKYPDFLKGFFEQKTGGGFRAVNIKIDTNTVVVMSFPVEVTQTETVQQLQEFDKLLNDKSRAFVHFILTQKPKCFDLNTLCFTVKGKQLHITDIAKKMQDPTFRSLVRQTPDHELRLIFVQLARERLWIPRICFS